jgi:F420H(2)-dependent quinone reductase
LSFREVVKRIRTRVVSGSIRRLGGTPLGVWAIKHVVTPLLRWIYRMSDGQRLSSGGLVGPILLLTTTGRRTGKERTTPLLYLRECQRLIICNVNPGFERPNPWTLNLRARPVVRVQIGREIGIYRGERLPRRRSSVTGRAW